MTEFDFRGRIPASKSLLNRWLVIRSFKPSLVVEGESGCDDVARMRSALATLARGQGGDLDCGAAGTTFRFLALRASRAKGRWRLLGSPELLRRPQGTLLNVLSQLGVPASLSEDGLEIEGGEWRRPQGPLLVDRGQSSQFASAVALSAWHLPFELEVEMVGADGGLALSEGYFAMTERVLLEAGLALRREGPRIRIAARSRPTAERARAESDMSSAFAIAALAAAAGRAEILDAPDSDLQPDSSFPEILAEMGASVAREGAALRVTKTGELRPIRRDLGGSPDLFPVLSVLCAYAGGDSTLHGAPHLAHKESSRIESTARLIARLGRRARARGDGLEIEGRPPGPPAVAPFEFDPEKDHRLAMAATVASAFGAPVTVADPAAVDKSFPEFWSFCERSGLKPPIPSASGVERGSAKPTRRT